MSTIVQQDAGSKSAGSKSAENKNKSLENNGNILRAKMINICPFIGQ
jgi:hypothetical protein